MTCVLEEVSPTCAQLGSTGSCTDMQSHFEIVADTANNQNTNAAQNTKCILSLVANIDYENELISHAGNTDRSITVVFTVVDSKGRISKKYGQRILVANINEAPVIALAPINVYEGEIQELTQESTRLKYSVIDYDADDGVGFPTYIGIPSVSGIWFSLVWYL